MAKSQQEKIAESTQTQLAEQQERWVAFANKAVENATKLVELNWTLTKDILDESTTAAQQLLSAKDPQELFSIDSGVVQTNFSRLLSYAAAITTITTDLQAELVKAAQIQIGDTFNNATNAVKESTQITQAPSSNPFELMKVAMENAKGGYEQWVATTTKVAEAMEGSLKMMPMGSPSTAKRSAAPSKKGDAS